MSMRSTRRAGPLAVVRAQAFGWDRALLATLCHVSLPWDEELPLVPLAGAGVLGSRDRLSLLAQFAAHEALLQFAGVADGELDPSEWAVARRRGTDIRLVRTGARACDPTLAPPPLGTLQQFGEMVGASSVVFAQAWARPDTVYAEIAIRLLEDAAADLRWMRLAAAGSIVSPGPEGLRSLVEHPGRYTFRDARLPAALLRFAGLDPSVGVIHLEGVSPLERYSALGPLVTDPSLTPAQVAEAVAARSADKPHAFVVTAVEAFDERSRAVVDILAGSGLSAWLIEDGGANRVADTREFVIAPRIEAAARLRSRLDAAETSSLVAGPDFQSYLRSGDVPAARVPFPLPGEPERSWIGALAMLGPRTRRDTAERFLGEFLFGGRIDQLFVPGLLEAEGEYVAFSSQDAMEAALAAIPAPSRAPIARLAAPYAEGVRAALLWLDGGEPARCTELLQSLDWESAGETVAALSLVPVTALGPRMTRRYAHALIDCGRYREACELASDDELVLARGERRQGDYATALARLRRMEPSFESDLLRAEVLRLHGLDAEARSALDRCSPRSPEEAIRLDYERGLHGEKVTLPVSHYLHARLETYRALEEGRYAEGSAHAAESHRRARCVAERIDASLDRLFAAFTAGRWNEARVIAVEALREVEETQGDRAAGGILFILAYLAADDGQWSPASRIVERLRRFYEANADTLRLAELDLLRAHLDFSRGRFAEAVPAARAVFEGRPHDQIREAAALILDEVNFLRGELQELRSTGRSGNAELTRRREALERRVQNPAERDTVRDLHQTVPSRLARFRDAVRVGNHDSARAFALELDLVYEPAPAPAEVELRMLRSAAVRQFPFAAHDFDVGWCWATRNRLGQWSSSGSFVPEGEPPALAQHDADWIACGDRELLYVEGSSRWSDAGRRAIGALFSSRAEGWRLRRLLDQEESARRPEEAALDGIIGQSPAIRAIESLVAKVAGREVAVCILGESGTGKELVARAIHRNSRRRQKPFTAVNCAALPETLIESELFGHVRGAFTGADRDRAGLIETTDGGTLFLDEVGELPLTAQAKLLRFLQDGEFRRVGDSSHRMSDVRIVSATNRGLESAVEEGQFREDLYYRIRGVEVTLPPLRERGADVLLLASSFLRSERERHRTGPATFSPDVEAVFSAYRWPGNVRELQNTVRAAHAMAGESRTIEVENLPERLRNVAPARAAAGSYQDAVSRFKRDLIERSLMEAGGNQNRAAALLKMSRQALAYQIRELGILVRV